ncbi:MAG: sensor histidine kinase [Flavobacteriales bacterium]|nr:sensor histidine kinase [Flavobacteriales bacterium]
MRFEKPDQLALFASAVTSVFVLFTFWLAHRITQTELDLTADLAVTAVSFLVGFLIFRYAVYQFIYKKVELLYKSIHDIRTGDFEDEEVTGDLDEVNREVSEWAENQRKEIAQLKVRESYRKEFIGNVSHELKTPIFNIQGYILTLLDGALEDEEINRAYLLRANKSVKRMIRLVHDLETITNLEAGALQMNLKPTDVLELAKDVIDTLELKVKKKEVDVRFKNKNQKSIRVLCDSERIKQVFTNLIVNGVNYSIREGGFVEISFSDMGAHWMVEISDNGLGIPEEDLPRLFERFYRVDKSRSREQGGTGLGLAIVKHIIEAHRQTITVRSKPGVGSTFAFTLKKA